MTDLHRDFQFLDVKCQMQDTLLELPSHSLLWQKASRKGDRDVHLDAHMVDANTALATGELQEAPVLRP